LLAVLSATLDTSCAANFLSDDEDPDEALIELVSLAITGQITLNVSEEAFEEIELTPDEETRQRRLARLKTFGRLELPEHQVDERDRLTGELHQALFPKAQAGSKKDEHNVRDCRQLATHRLIGRELFVTRDQRLLKGAEVASEHGINLVGPEQALERIEAERAEHDLASYPAISVRDADLERDESDIRRVLAPLRKDYPDFDAWLTSALKKPATRVRLGEFDGRVEAVALSQAKNDRVVKLSAFFVADVAREGGLGAHLLWSELRTWARHDIEKVYVTVSSRHADLVGFFTAFGFLIEGVSPRRYQDDASELVLGKHFLRERATDDSLPEFATQYADIVFRVPAGAEVDQTGWAVAPKAQRPELGWEGHAAQLELVARADGAAVRRWSLLDLERIFYPVRFAVQDRKALMVPIEPQWAAALLEHAGQQRELGQDLGSERLVLRADNAYYCYPKSLEVAKPGTPILFYVSAPVSAVVGEARILASAVDLPEELFATFGGLGIYRLPEIRSHVMDRGRRKGQALALRFGLYVPFPELVEAEALEKIAGKRRVPQGLTSISFEEFERIRRTGGLEW
jgi:N-acetylglutamate synthase-like GNAT family acetyltransferase